MRQTDRQNFARLDLMQYYGRMPICELNDLSKAQENIRNNAPTEAARHTNLQSALGVLKDIIGMAAASNESPYFKMDGQSPFSPEQQKWHSVVSRFGQAIEDWQQNNSGKIPTDMQKREIAQGILFPQGALAQHAQLRVETGDGSWELRDPVSLWVAQQLQAQGKIVSDDIITTAKKALIAQNPNIEKEYKNISLVPAQQKNGE
jgi:hypothetical protein